MKISTLKLVLKNEIDCQSASRETMTKKMFYTLLGILFLLGFVYLGISVLFGEVLQSVNVRACLLKSLTGYPCATCGTTRSVLLLFAGRPYDAFMMNPLGVIVGSMILILPLITLIDWLTGKAFLFRAYCNIERSLINRRWLSIALIALLILNWIWNIQKEL